jgi:hypothetical protein
MVFGTIILDIHTLFYAALCIVLGVQSMQFGVFAKLYGIHEGLVPPDPSFDRLVRVLSLENGLLASAVLLLMGLGLGVAALSTWGSVAFGALSPETVMRIVIPSGTCILLAFQTAYGAFFMSLLGIRSTRGQTDQYTELASRSRATA